MQKRSYDINQIDLDWTIWICSI